MRRPRTPEPKGDYIDGWDQWDDVDPSEMGEFKCILTGIGILLTLVSAFALFLWAVLA